MKGKNLKAVGEERAAGCEWNELFPEECHLAFRDMEPRPGNVYRARLQRKGLHNLDVVTRSVIPDDAGARDMQFAIWACFPVVAEGMGLHHWRGRGVHLVL